MMKILKPCRNFLSVRHPIVLKVFAMMALLSICSRELCSTPQERDSQIYTNPKVLHQTIPSYTEEAIKAKVQGHILLQAVVRQDGSITDFKVLRGLGYGLEEKAIREIASNWKFKPGTRNGVPIDQRVVIEVTFNLSGSESSGSTPTQTRVTHTTYENPEGPHRAGIQFRVTDRMGRPAANQDFIICEGENKVYRLKGITDSHGMYRDPWLDERHYRSVRALLRHGEDLYTLFENISLERGKMIAFDIRLDQLSPPWTPIQINSDSGELASEVVWWRKQIQSRSVKPRNQGLKIRPITGRLTRSAAAEQVGAAIRARTERLLVPVSLVVLDPEVQTTYVPFKKGACAKLTETNPDVLSLIAGRLASLHEHTVSRTYFDVQCPIGVRHEFNDSFCHLVISPDLRQHIGDLLHYRKQDSLTLWGEPLVYSPVQRYINYWKSPALSLATMAGSLEMILAIAEAVAVTGISEQPGFGTATVQFSWQFKPTRIGSLLPTILSADKLQPRTGVATFRKYDDGWRLQLPFDTGW